MKGMMMDGIWNVLGGRHYCMVDDEGAAEAGAAGGGDAPEAGGEGGALSGGGDAPEAGESGVGGIDWGSATADSLFASVEMPDIDGVKVDANLVKERYGDFCIKHRISPKAVSEFLKLDAEDATKAREASRRAEAEEERKDMENFNAQGDALRREFSQVQIDEAVDTLRHDSSLNGDRDFMEAVTGPMSNNKTMMRLILNWAEHHRVDSTPGAARGSSASGRQGFAARWTGMDIR